MRSTLLGLSIIWLACAEGLAAQQAPQAPPSGPSTFPFHEELIAELSPGSRIDAVGKLTG